MAGALPAKVEVDDAGDTDMVDDGAGLGAGDGLGAGELRAEEQGLGAGGFLKMAASR